MAYWKFANRETFDTWHDAACDAAGLPRPGRNAATGEVEPDAAWTVALVDGQEQDDGSVTAEVPDEWALAMPAGVVAADPPEVTNPLSTDGEPH